MKTVFLSLFCLMIAISFSQINGQGKKETKKTESKGAKKTMLVAVMKTTMGTIELELFEKQAPKTVENFVGLAKKDYYKGILFHRVIDGFMIQGGDPSGNGTGGKSIWGKPFADEFDATLKHDKPGILSMANAGPNTNGSQFFITLVPTPHLNMRHTIFGQVIKGMEVVSAIGKVPTSRGNDKPIKDVKIESLKIETRTK